MTRFQKTEEDKTSDKSTDLKFPRFRINTTLSSSSSSSSSQLDTTSVPEQTTEKKKTSSLSLISPSLPTVPPPPSSAFTDYVNKKENEIFLNVDSLCNAPTESDDNTFSENSTETAKINEEIINLRELNILFSYVCLIIFNLLKFTFMPIIKIVEIIQNHYKTFKMLESKEKTKKEEEIKLLYLKRECQNLQRDINKLCQEPIEITAICNGNKVIVPLNIFK